VPIYLQVEPRLDDRAARTVSDQAKKHFSDAGKTAGADFSKALSSGLSSSDSAIRKSAENAEKAFKKVADSAGQARVEEAKLEDLRSKGAGATAMLTQSERLERARRAEVSTTRTAVTALRDLDTAQLSAVTSGSALSNLLSGIASGASGTRLGGLATQAESLSTKLGGISPVAVGATAGIAAIALGAIEGAKALYSLGATWDDISDTITGRTGIMGDQLNAITDSIKDVGRQSAISFEDIGQFAGGVAQSLHLTGAEATAMTQKLADIQQVTKQVVDTRDLGKAFRLFDVTDVNSQIQTLQQLTAASQATDIPINNLLATLSNTGKASKEAGLNLQQTVGVMLTLEDAGVSFEKSGSSLAIFLKNAAKDGRDANQVLAEGITQIKAFVDAGNDPAATKLAVNLFGGKGYLDFFNAIKSGKLDVDNLTGALEKLGGTGDLIGDQKKATEDWQESLGKITNSLTADLGPVADKTFNGINTALQWLTRGMHAADDEVKNLATSINSLKPDALAAALGLPGMPGAPAAPAGPGLPTTRPGTPTTGLGPNFYKDWYKTPEELKREQGSGPKLPTTPEVAYDTSLPPGYAGVPQTSEIVGAENSWMDARHTLAEKQARLDQLEKDNSATADDITKARNDVINAQQGQNQAEMRLSDARQSLYDKDTKQLNSHATQLGEIGAKLDQDFGISKGLPGIADNLTKFIANLAFAPMMGKLSAISAANPSQGGYGAIGVAAAQGAFGPQYTGLPQPASASPTSAPSQTGYSAAAPSGYSATSASSGIPTPGGGAGAERWRGTVAAAVDKYGPQVGVTPANRQKWIDSIVSQIGTESGGNPGADNPNDTNGQGGTQHVSGLLQYLPSSYAMSGGKLTGLPYMDPVGQIAGALFAPRNADGSPSATAPGGIGAGHGWGPVPTPISGTPGTTSPAVTNPLGPGGPPSLAGVPSMAGGPPGTGMPQGAPFATAGGPGGPTPGPTPIGGVEPAAGSGKGGGVGITPGGSIDTAIGVAASGLDLLAPGAGQAAQTGIKLASRAIQYGGQVAGIATQGLMDTFLPTGGSELANHSWITKIAGGIAGASPALPNMAGKATAPKAQEGTPASGQGSGPPPGPTINVTNQRATEDGTGRDIAWHAQNMYQPAGQP
jgi:hypothetical protein